MEEIPNNHLGCKKPYKYWDIYYINWCRISSINSMSGRYGTLGAPGRLTVAMKERFGFHHPITSTSMVYLPTNLALNINMKPMYVFLSPMDPLDIIPPFKKQTCSPLQKRKNLFSWQCWKQKLPRSLTSKTQEEETCFQTHGFFGR